MDDPADLAQELAVCLQGLEESDCREVLEIFLDSLDGEARTQLADLFRT